MEKVDYLRLRTLADVKAERTRIGDRIDRAEARLKEDYSRITRLFDFDYIAEAIARKMATIYGIIETVMSGYQMVSSLVGKFRSHRCDDRNDDDRQCE